MTTVVHGITSTTSVDVGTDTVIKSLTAMEVQIKLHRPDDALLNLVSLRMLDQWNIVLIQDPWASTGCTKALKGNNTKSIYWSGSLEEDQEQ